MTKLLMLTTQEATADQLFKVSDVLKRLLPDAMIYGCDDADRVEAILAAFHGRQS